MPTAEFSQARPEDEGVIIRLTEAAYAPYTASFGYPPLPVTEDYGPRIARGEVWLMQEAGDLVGLAVIEDAGDHALVFSFAIDPSRQGQGWGRRLLEFSETVTRGLGHDEIRLYTNSRMERNIAIYAAHGYAETGRRPNPKRPGWTIVDMAKRLA